MEKGIWTPSRNRELQVEWKTTENQMEQLSQEASRTLRRLISTDKEGIRACISSALQTVVREASKDRKWGVVANTLRTQAELWGVMSPQQIDVHQQLEQLTDDELTKRTVELVAQLSAKADDHTEH
jgi:hypothetical protein